MIKSIKLRSGKRKRARRLFQDPYQTHRGAAFPDDPELISACRLCGGID